MHFCDPDTYGNKNIMVQKIPPEGSNTTIVPWATSVLSYENNDVFSKISAVYNQYFVKTCFCFSLSL